MAAQLVNCKKCGKLYLRIKPICEDCYRKQEDDFDKVTDYLREYPGSTIQELSEATKVTVGQIREFILAERILATNFMNLSYPCDTCGTMINSGKICTNCYSTINQLAKKILNEEKPKATEKGKSGSGYITRNL